MAIGDRRPEEENGGTGKRKRRREDELVMMFIFCTICVKYFYTQCCLNIVYILDIQSINELAQFLFLKGGMRNVYEPIS